MFAVYAFIVIIIECIVEYLLKIVLGFSVTNAFIVGVLLYGAITGWAIKLGMIRKRKKVNFGIIFLSFVLLTINFIGINYVDYRTVYYNGEQIVTYNIFKSNNGKHISNYGYLEGKKYKYFNFLSYERYSLKNSRLEIGPHFDFLDEENESTPISNYIMTALDYIIILSIGMLVIVANEDTKSLRKRIN